jgi:hypothetical protein
MHVTRNFLAKTKINHLYEDPRALSLKIMAGGSLATLILVLDEPWALEVRATQL